jgi:hypothetical protein
VPTYRTGNNAYCIQSIGSPGGTGVAVANTASAIFGLQRQDLAYDSRTLERTYRDFTFDPARYLGEQEAPPEPPGSGTADGGAWSFAGVATGQTTKQGTGTGTWSFTGTAAGATTKRGTGTGSWTFTGAAAGTTVKRGTGTGTWSFTGTAVGQATKRGTGAGTLTYAGTAVGYTPPPYTTVPRHAATTGQNPDQSLTTNSTTPTANSLLFVFYGVINDNHTTAPVLSAPSGGGLSFTLVDKVGDTVVIPAEGLYPESRIASACYFAAVGSSPTAHTLTVDAYTGTELGLYAAASIDVTGYDPGTPIVQSKATGAALGGGDTESGTITLDSAPTAGNLLVVTFVVFGNSNATISAPTAGSGKTMLEQGTQFPFTNSLLGIWTRLCDGTESATITCPDLGSGWATYSYTAHAVEIQDPVPGSGTGAGALVLTGTATGASVKAGTAEGTVSWVGASSGATTKQGTSSGLTTWAGTAVGDAPVPGLQEGSGSGSWSYSGTAVGATTKRGTASGSWLYTGTAVGTAPGEVVDPATPPERMLTVAADSRIFGVPTADRQHAVSSADRILPVYDNQRRELVT